MKLHTVMLPIFVLLLFANLFSLGGQAFADEAMRQTMEIFLEVNRVSAANLITSMFLSSTQAKELMKLAHEAKAERDIFEKRVESIHPEAMKTLKKMREELTRTRSIGAQTRDEVTHLEIQMMQAFHPHEKKMKELSNKAKDVLTKNQYVLLAEFKPCLKLPKESTNPERVGQVNDNSVFVKFLSRARALSKEQYAQKENEYLENIIRLKDKLHVDYGDRKKEEARIGKILRNARALSSSDYELKKQALADELFNLPQMVRLCDAEALKRIEEYLLEPSMIPLYETIAKEGPK